MSYTASGFPGNIEPKHGDEAKVLFLDGHVESLVPSTIPMQSNAPHGDTDL